MLNLNISGETKYLAIFNININCWLMEIPIAKLIQNLYLALTFNNLTDIV